MKKNTLFLFALLCLVLQVFQACGQQSGNINSKTSKKNVVMDTNQLPKTEEQWKQVLTNEQYYILREKGTERPFTGKWLLNNDKGVYKCAGCGNELFTSDMKFNSHCGWPSFDKEIAGGKINQTEDVSHGMHRIEITCAKCGGHLGHIFDDGPTETGKRYCVNSVSLEFVPENATTNNNLDTIVLGGGCYWCVEAVYEMLDGVIKVESGFSGGTVENPTYKQVCTGETGHAEVVQITFDKTKTNIAEILKVFFTVHDPTQLNRQGNDVGTQYRSVIYYKNQEQKTTSEQIIAALQQEKVYADPIVTEVSPLQKFYKAEDYHQNYYQQNKQQPYCNLVVRPKVEKFEKVFKNRLKKNNP